jgi:hypothetical protein
MNYKSDNLTPEQKKNTLTSIFLLSLVIVAFIIYKNSIDNERNELLSKNTEITICKIIRTNTHKSTTNTVEYKVSNKRYTYEGLSYRIFQIGEMFNLKYSIKKPSISEVIYSQPVITNITDYIEIEAEISSLYSNSRINIVEFKYHYLQKDYERDIYVTKNIINNYQEGSRYKILVNKKNPKISYLKSVIKVID